MGGEKAHSPVSPRLPFARQLGMWGPVSALVTDHSTAASVTGDGWQGERVTERAVFVYFTNHAMSR